MRRLFPAVAVTLGLWASTASAQELKMDKHVLSNGLTVYTHESHAAPLMSFQIFFKVGSINERIGHTGISHLFEHMMFNGSAKYGPKEFDTKLEAAGGYSNGFTMQDLTAYLETFPPDAIDLVLDMEADRLANLTITEKNLEQERGIVKEERRLRVDNDNLGKLDELMWLMAYTGHPYHTPVVGFMADLNNITLQDTQRYFDTYYTPNNAIAVVTGDFKTPELIKKMEATLGRVKRGPEVPPPYGVEPPQEGERRATIVREAELPMLMAGWHVPGATGEEQDLVALDVLQALLFKGESSRLFQSLIYSKEVASEVQVYNQTLRGPSLFLIVVQGAPGKKIEDAEALLHQELEALGKTPVPDAELMKAKNQLRADAIRALKTVEGRANQIGMHAVMYGDPAALARLIEARDKVTAADIQRVVQKYFTRENRSVITLYPRKDVGTGEASQAALPREEVRP